MLRSLANDLIMYEKIDTTIPRAKATQSFIERLITKSKENTLNNKRQVEKALGLDNTVKKMFEVIGPKFKERPGGYTRLIKIGVRSGDSSTVARLQFTEVVSSLVETTKETKVEEKGKGKGLAILKRKPKITVKKTTRLDSAKRAKKEVVEKKPTSKVKKV